MNSTSAIQDTKNSCPIVFILGHARSGTTLLQTILDTHPQIASALESRFAIHYMNRYNGIEHWGSKEKEKFLNDILSEQKIHYFWEIDKKSLSDRLTQLSPKSPYSSFCKAVYLSRKSIFKKSEPKLIIDKNPIYALMISHLLKVFPNAKFVHIVRDPRASASSALQLVKGLQPKHPAYRWLSVNQEIESFKQLTEFKCHTLRYEDLLSKPTEVLDQLAAYLGISPNFDFSYYETVNSAVSSYIDRSPTEKIKTFRELGMSKVHSNIRTPINPSFIDKWKEKLNSDQVSVIDAICGELATSYGYIIENMPIQNPKIPLTEIIYVKKLAIYYSLPIWLRELKSKPNMGFIEPQ